MLQLRVSYHLQEYKKKHEPKTSLLIGLVTNPYVLMKVYVIDVSSFTPADSTVSTKPMHH
jgi:hypothetical protein